MNITELEKELKTYSNYFILNINIYDKDKKLLNNYKINIKYGRNNVYI